MTDIHSIDIKKLSRKRRKALKRRMKRKQIHKQVAGTIEKRRRAEKRFVMYGQVAVAVCIIFLVLLLGKIILGGYSAFMQTKIKVPITFDKVLVEQDNFRKIMSNSLQNHFGDVSGRRNKRMLGGIFTQDVAGDIKKYLEQHPQKQGQTVEIWLVASSVVDMYYKGKLDVSVSEDKRKLKDKQLGWIKQLESENNISGFFNADFLTQGDSRSPERAGMLGAIVGSLFVVIACMVVAFPLGVMTAIYLEEFAPKNKISEFIEVNINNLAAVPSIVFGLLGLMLYLQIFGIPRSAALAGGLTLALMALPVIVISTRASIRAIPQSIRDGAMALGASKLQTTMHHVLPLAMPGIMTGTILSMARILGETAPLLMIGMVAFVADIPGSFTDAATAMPVQIYLWSDSAEPGFIEKTSAGIMVLLIFLLCVNALAVWVRKKCEIRW